MFTLPTIKKKSGGRTGSDGVGGLSASNRDPVESRHRIGCLRLLEWKIRTLFDQDRSKRRNAQIVSAGAATRQAPEHPPHDSGAL
jgi:hypothetical protein